MECQLCITYGGEPVEIESNDLSSLRSHVRNHQWQTNEFSSEATKIYSNWCFSNVDLEWDEDVTENSNIVETVGQNLSGTPFNGSIQDYCCQLLKDHPGTRVKCAVCHARLRSLPKSHSLASRFRTALSHAYVHLNTTLFSCRHCKYEGKTPRSVAQHVNTHHRLPFISSHYMDKSDSFRDQILAILDQCYGTEKDVHPKLTKSKATTKVAISKSTAVRPKQTQTKPAKSVGSEIRIVRSRFSTPASLHCLKLLKTNSKDGHIYCGQCKALVNCSNGPLNTYNTRSVMDHMGRRHLKKDLYQCKQCDFASPALHDVMNHIKKRHNGLARGNYIDRSKNYEKQIIRMLSKCFGGTVQNDWNSMDMGDGTFLNTYDQPKMPVQVKSVKHCIAKKNIATKKSRIQKSSNLTSNLRRAMAKKRGSINNICLEVLKKNAQDGKIRCNLCTKDICIRDRSQPFKTPMAINHVQVMHTKFQIFRCDLCQYTTKTRPSVGSHIVQIHNVSSRGKYTDHSDKYKRQITDMILKCFGKDQEEEKESNSNGTGLDTDAAMDDGPSTSGLIDPGFIQMTSPMIWQCKRCSYATKHAKLIKNHVANHKYL